MKEKIRYYKNSEMVEKEISYIPFRYYAAIILALLETLAILAIMTALCYYVPYFYILVWLTEIACVVRIASSEDNPDYKVPWLLLVLSVPLAGFMLYFLFYSRKLKKKYIRRLNLIKDHTYKKDDSVAFEKLKNESRVAYNQARLICKVSESHLFTNTKQEYFSLGEYVFERMLADLKKAEKFIYMEYFIIEEGLFWNTILEVLKEKAKSGIEVKLVYDDIGCMGTLPGNYFKILRQDGIEAVPFSILKGNADSEFNNRSHRKITVIDGKIGYTGGINIADEYINEIVKYGHWKDIGIRIEGEAVKELTKLFLIDFGINVKNTPVITDYHFPDVPAYESNGYMIPFGDGPRPIYERRVGKIIIQNMISQANHYVYIMTPYLIVDNEMCQTIENAALRGIDIRIIVPHIPDKKLIFEMTRSYYNRFIKVGVKIYEYKSGFIHAKSYLADDKFAMIGTINMDYRSLVHHFENGIWMCGCECIADMKADFEKTLDQSIAIDWNRMQSSLTKQIIRALVKIFSPML